MNVGELIQSYFGGDNAKHLAQAVGIDANLAQKALGIGLPMQVDALADHAATPTGQSQIMEAISSLPQFGSIADVLGSAEGAGNLQRAGELLAPALLGGKADSIVNSVTSQVGGSVGGIQKLMQMALPLLLSQLGRQGVNAGGLGALLGGLKGNLGGLGNLAGVAAGAAGLAGAAQAGGVNLPGAGGANTVNAILDLLKGQFSGANADKIGSAAGFTGSTAGRAVQGAWPVVLNALVNKGKTEAGAGDLLKMMGQFAGLTEGTGNLNAGMLGDAAEMARLEGQGRGLLGGLFGNVDEITGRLGTALGGSGSNAGRLLSLLTPLLLSLLGKKTTGMNASALSGLLGGLGGNLTSLLPAGLSGLGALLGTQAVAAKPEVKVATPVTPAPRVDTAAPAPRPVTPPAAPVSTVTTATTEKRGGFPWWWILLPLLLLGGCLYANRSKTATTTTPPATTTPAESGTTTPASDGTFAITDPAADATLAAGSFDLKGTGKAGDEVEIFEDGNSLGKTKIGDDGTWTYKVAAPAAGAHTYSVKGPDGAELGNVATTVEAATGNAADCTKDYTLSVADGATISEPFRFGGEGQGKGYSVTVKRGDRTIGTKDIPLDGACGWSYMSKPGKGAVTYEVRPMGDAAAAPLSTVNMTVQ